jgi:hypothetical protein
MMPRFSVARRTRSCVAPTTSIVTSTSFVAAAASSRPVAEKKRVSTVKGAVTTAAPELPRRIAVVMPAPCGDSSASWSSRWRAA